MPLLDFLWLYKDCRLLLRLRPLPCLAGCFPTDSNVTENAVVTNDIGKKKMVIMDIACWTTYTVKPTRLLIWWVFCSASKLKYSRVEWLAFIGSFEEKAWIWSRWLDCDVHFLFGRKDLNIHSQVSTDSCKSQAWMWNHLSTFWFQQLKQFTELVRKEYHKLSPLWRTKAFRSFHFKFALTIIQRGRFNESLFNLDTAKCLTVA